MRLKQSLLAVIVGTNIFFAQAAAGQTRLGLHVTQEEVNAWKQRIANGPYKTTGDVSPNSPGDWTRIQDNANNFLGNPSAERWTGQSAASCWNWRSNSPSLPGRDRGEKLRDAAFVYLLTGDVTYRDAVRNELLAQAATAGTNWNDSGRWTVSNSCTWGDAYNHEIMIWLTRLIFGYDYIRGSLSGADQTTLDNWFRSAGVFWENVTHTSMLTARFPNRKSDDYVNYDHAYDPLGEDGSGPVVTHFNGWTKRGWHEGWNNRNGSQALMFGLVGILTNNDTLKTEAKRYFKEWLRFSVFPDGTHADFHRWIDGPPTQGWAYAGSMIADMVILADAFARTGDTELYDFSTADGLFGTAGGPKTLYKVIKLFMEHVNGAVVRYGTDQPSRNGNPAYKIDTVDELYGLSRIHDTWMSQANVYFKDAYLQSIYMRTASGAPPYPSSVASAGFGVYSGVGGVFPGQLLMFGQMEGQVWPYPTGRQTGSVNLTATPTSIVSGESSTLSWNATNATDCSASGAWSGTKAISGTEAVNPSQTATYTLTCTGPIGSNSQSVTVTVSSSRVGPSLANSSTLMAHSDNFSPIQGPEKLWDGDTITEEGSAGNEGVSSFWVEFDFGASYNLSKALIFGDALGDWLCVTWTFEHKQNSNDAYAVDFADAPCNANQWFEQALSGTTARFVRVTVSGNPDTVATQARELQIEGTAAVKPPNAPSNLSITQLQP